MNSASATPLRVGAVQYLNSKPLANYIDLSSPPPVDLILDFPSRLTEMMDEGHLDVALLPSIEYFRRRDCKIIAGICISADGVVESVRIFSKKPIDEIQSLALDKSSRTSVALAKILLKRRLEALPDLTSCSPDDRLEEIESDAMLLIGDAAMKFMPDNQVFALDLGEEWKRLTSLPFVYAMWVAKADIDTEALRGKLLEAREKGLARIEDISSQAESELTIDKDVSINYLRDIIKYDLGHRELESLRLFQKYAAEDGLCLGDVDIVLDD